MCFTEIWEKATCFLSRNPLGLGWKLPQRQPLDSLGSTSICEAAGWPTGPKCLLQCFGASLGTETFRSTHFCYLFFGVERNKHQWHVWIFVDIWYYIQIYVDYSYLLFFCEKNVPSKESDTTKKNWLINWWFFWKEAESLQLMHQHLVDAGGANLDFEPMDRNWAIKQNTVNSGCHGRIGSP